MQRAQFLAAVPLRSSIALPLMLAYIEAKGYKHLLHSKQCSTPGPFMRQLGFEREHGKVYLCKRRVNRSCQNIGLSMRRGTQNFAKGKIPIDVAAARKQMLLKVLWVAVKHKIFPFIFQIVGLL